MWDEPAATHDVGVGMTYRRVLLGVFVAAQVSVPLVVYLVRLSTGVKLTPWGWQMYS
jgi:hypothetical protein